MSNVEDKGANAFDNGWAAHDCGRPRDSNFFAAHIDSELRQLWFDGWDCAAAVANFGTDANDTIDD